LSSPSSLHDSNPPVWLPLAPWGFVILWSAGYGVAKMCLEDTTPLNLLAMRFVFTSLVLLIPVLIWRLPMPSPGHWRHIFVGAITIHVAHFGMIYGGLSLGASAGILALFAASQPMLVEVAASIWRRRLPSPLLAVGLVVGMAGAVYVIIARGEFSGDALLGVIMGFVAVIALSAGTAYERFYTPPGHRVSNYFMQYVMAMTVAVPVALIVEGVHINPTLNLGLGIAYLVLGNAVTGIFLLLTMVRFGALSRVTSVMFLVPGLGALIAWLVVGEVMPPSAWPGIFLAGAGVLIVLYGEQICRYSRTVFHR